MMLVIMRDARLILGVGLVVGYPHEVGVNCFHFRDPPVVVFVVKSNDEAFGMHDDDVAGGGTTIVRSMAA